MVFARGGLGAEREDRFKSGFFELGADRELFSGW